MPGHDIVVVGASTGGVEALMKLAGGLPEDLPAALFVVLHIPAEAPSLLPGLLSRAGPLEAGHFADGEKINHGRIYVAPPDQHLLIERGRIRYWHGPRENSTRPAVDPLFRSAARAYGPRVVGVVLTGALNDGTTGLGEIKRYGGTAVVQDPEEAAFPGMPGSALEQVAVDYCLPLAKVPDLLVRLSLEPVEERGEAMAREENGNVPERMEDLGSPSVFSCPECAGPLWELSEGNITRFVCRVGHAYTPESVLAEQAGGVEEALYYALNVLRESTLMSERLAEQARERNHFMAAERFEERAREADRKAEVIRRVLEA